MTEAVTAFDVFLNETHVGQLSYVSQTNHTAFVLSQGYMAQENPPILSLSFRNKLGGFARTRESTMVSLPPFFSNLLPEKGLLRSLLVKRASLRSTCDFELLSLLREDLPGAVILQPAAGQPLPVDLRITNLSQSASVLKASGPLQFSLAGVQLKFSGSLQDGRLTIPVTGAGGDWIVKVPHNQYPHVSENEYSIMAFAKSIGIDVPPISLLDPEEIDGLPPEIVMREGKSYIIKRFDRTATGRRVHIEDFAQVFNLQPVHKYDQASYGNIAAVIWRECGEEGLVEFIRRLVFCIIMGNMDMHLKNWSLIYNDPSTAQLSPAYDLMSTIVYPGSDQKLALSLSGTKFANKINSGHIKKLVAVAQLPEALVLKTVNETSRAIANSWSDYRHTFPPSLLPALEKHMQSLPLLPAIVAAPGPALTTTTHNSHSKADADQQKWLAKLTEKEFDQVRGSLEVMRKTLGGVATETSWEENARVGSLSSAFQTDTLQIQLFFDGWAESPGSQLELMPSRDSIVIAHPVGPHLTVEFQTPDGVDLAIFGFKYIIYNGQPAWESLIKSSEAASFLSTDQTAAILRKEVDLLAGTKSQDEQCTLDIEYLTATKKLVTVKDSVQHIRGSLILEDSETKQLWNVLEPNEKLELPGLTGTGVHIAPLSLSRAHEAGLIGRFPSDREKEITGKEIISERLTIYLLEFPVDGFTQTYWRDNKNGATLVVSTDGIIQSIDFSLRDLFGVIADDSVVARVDGQLYRFIRGMDPRYAEAVKFLLASFGATQVAMDISPDLLHYLLEEGWIAVVPQNGRYQMTTRGLMETLKHRPA